MKEYKFSGRQELAFIILFLTAGFILVQLMLYAGFGLFYFLNNGVFPTVELSFTDMLLRSVLCSLGGGIFVWLGYRHAYKRSGRF